MKKICFLFVCFLIYACTNQSIKQNVENIKYIKNTKIESYNINKDQLEKYQWCGILYNRYYLIYEFNDSTVKCVSTELKNSSIPYTFVGTYNILRKNQETTIHIKFYVDDYFIDFIVEQDSTSLFLDRGDLILRPKTKIPILIKE